MLLERIDIDSCGSLERIQLGPFSHRLNAVFGPPGSGKTATIEFVRSVMLGTDRHWHQGCAGRVVWSGRDGLLHCRREADGTAHGRLSMDFVDRNGYSQSNMNSYRDGDIYGRFSGLVDLPRLAIDALVAPSRETSFGKMVEACRLLGLTDVEKVRDEAEIQRIRNQLADVNQRLAELAPTAYDSTAYDSAAYDTTTLHQADSRYGETLQHEYRQLDATIFDDARRYQTVQAGLQERRRFLVDELARLDRYEQRTDTDASVDSRRARLEVRLADARDEVARLRNQESDLRRSLADVERELADFSQTSSVHESSVRIASARRQQLEELDNQLMRLGRTLREIRSIRDNWTTGETLSTVLHESAAMRYYTTEAGRDTNGYYRSRLEAARRHLDWLMRHYDGRYENRSVDPRTVTDPLDTYSLNTYALESAYIGRSDLESMMTTIRELIDSLGRLDFKVTATQIHDQHLRQCEATLGATIRRLVEQRSSLLQQIATEHNLSLNNLSEAFGDWGQCHDQPHLYQWLLSEHFPPRVEDSVVRSARRRRLESERTELLDELSRTVNRLDDSVREVRTLELRFRSLQTEVPVRVDHRRRDVVRNELAAVESRLNWLENRYRLEEERRTLQRRLEKLLAGTQRVSTLRQRATYWLDQMTGGRLNHLLVQGSVSDFEPFGADPASNDPFRFDRATSPTERNLVSLSLRMAAADLLGRRGTHLPLLLDDPPAGWFRSLDTSPLINAWSRFVDAGNQLIAFTAHRGLVENIRTQGGFVQSLVPSHYYHMRYRDTWEDREPSLGNVNRELDTVWREANGFYDDPHWYRPNDLKYPSSNGHSYTANGHASAPNGLASARAVRYYDWADEYAPQQRPAHEFDAEATSRVVRGPASPFFLTEDSPVDQAPSIDAVAAQRLRVIGITVVGQLLSADPARLANRLELADVSPAVVNRWQHEANLVCGVPQLRNFDARVLVGCGFTSPSQLARMHPGRLLERVEAFLATDRGRQILRSGTSYELSRITSWIAAANRSVARDGRHPRGRQQSEYSYQTEESPREYDARASSRTRTRKRSRSSEYAVRSRDTAEPNFIARVGDRESRVDDGAESAVRRSRRKRRTREARSTRSSGSRGYGERHETVARASVQNESSLRFYLHRESPIVDAPSIGPKTAVKLQAIGVRTVEQFLTMDSATISNKLGNRRITPDRIKSWQRQATLVCRVPMLRGHDAQLLVEAGIFEPERLADCEPTWLLAKIDPVAKSAEGKRILRGAKRPDLEEVTDWINWSKDHRTLKAA